MPLEQNPAHKKSETVAGLDDAAKGPLDAFDYWHSLVDEKAAAAFLKLTDRTMQAYRHRGGGPRYIRLSSRCIRYRRVDLRAWVEARIRTRAISDLTES